MTTPSVDTVVQVNEYGGIQVRAPHPPLVQPVPISLGCDVMVWVDAADPGSGSMDIDTTDDIRVLGGLLGPAGLDRITSLPFYDGSLVEDPHPLSFTPGPLWHQCGRLGVARWQAEWTPIPMDSALVDLDLAVAAAGLGTTGFTDVAADRFFRRADILAALAERLPVDSSMDARVADAIGTAVIRSLPYLAEVATPVRTTILGAADHIHTAAARKTTGAQVRMDELMTQITAALRVAPMPSSRRRPVVLRGAQSQVKETFSVDWARVPRGALDPGEDTVSVTISDRHLSVEVLAAIGPTAPGPRTGFRFEVLRDGDILALASLGFDPAAGLYRGEVTLPVDFRSGDVVDIRHDAALSSTRTGIAADLERARRHGSWAVGFERLAALIDEPSGLLREAEKEWSFAARLVPGRDPHTLLKETYRQRSRNVGSPPPGPAASPTLAELARAGLLT